MEKQVEPGLNDDGSLAADLSWRDDCASVADLTSRDDYTSTADLSSCDDYASAHSAESVRLAFVLLTWNSSRYILNCLQSLLTLHPAYLIRLHIVDNGSTDDTCERIGQFRSEHPEIMVNLWKNSRNLGTTVPRNQALRDIDHWFDYVCVLDSDTIINRQAFDRMVAALKRNRRILLAAPRMFNLDRQEQCSVKRFPTVQLKLLKGCPVKAWHERGAQLEQYPFMPSPESYTLFRPDGLPVSSDHNVYPADYAISACWLLKRETLDLIGLLDERIFYAPEDVDYCAMIREAGFGIALVSDASIYHLTQRISHKKLISSINLSHVTGLIHYFIKHHYCFNARHLSNG